jgi:ectoine hydroxylase-related dioxygenase (phytanoyl-CoA dioxygenase family)
VGNRVWQRVNDYFLTSTLRNSWVHLPAISIHQTYTQSNTSKPKQHGDKSHTSISNPQLSTTVTFSVRPGTQAQSLHRDDDIYHTHLPASPVHDLGRDTMVCFFVAGSKTTKANGATRIVPGSHLWDFSVPPPPSSSPDIQAMEMDPGDAFFMLGGTYHGAGANTTANQERLIFAAFATRGYLRQEENQFLANRDLDKLRMLPEEVLRFAGFGCGKPYMGWVDMEDPMNRVLGFEHDGNEQEFW